MNTPLSDARLMLLTSSGHFVKGDDPNPLGVEQMTQTQAEQQIMSFIKKAPVLSTIPVDTPTDRLVVRHGGYDVRGARRDPNVSLPLQRLRELAADGVFAGLSDPVYSFVGACSQVRLLKKDGPDWVAAVQRPTCRWCTAGAGLTGVSRVRGTRCAPDGSIRHPHRGGGRRRL